MINCGPDGGPSETTRTTSFADAITVEDLETDPYPIYARLRAEAPVAHVPAVGLWMVTRAKDVQYVSSTPELFSAQVENSPVDISFGGSTMMTLDGEPHLELRRSLGDKYAPRVVDTWVADVVRPIVEHYLAELLARPERAAELRTEYFEPISVLSLATVVGIGHLPASQLQDWFYGLAAGASNFERDPEKQRASDRVAAEMDTILRPLMAKLAVEPDDSTMASMLTHGCPVGQPRTVGQVMPSLKLLLTGGMQEPGHGAASCLAGLLTHPEQLEWVREDPARWASAVHEGLRWVAPIGTQTRQATQDVELGGTTIPRGAMVASVIASACRDEAAVDRPDEFDVRRPRAMHPSFGYGRHACAGHAFARAQERIALEALLDAAPELHLDQNHELVFRGWEFRAPAALHVRW